jgi:hypothetical protein
MAARDASRRRPVSMRTFVDSVMEPTEIASVVRGGSLNWVLPCCYLARCAELGSRALVGTQQSPANAFRSYRTRCVFNCLICCLIRWFCSHAERYITVKHCVTLERAAGCHGMGEPAEWLCSNEKNVRSPAEVAATCQTTALRTSASWSFPAVCAPLTEW